MSKQTAVEWLIAQLNKEGFAPVVTQEEIDQAKAMEREKNDIFDKFLEAEKNFGISDKKTIERVQWYYRTYFNETYGVEQMTREEKLETIVKLFSKAMFYGNWKWETANERVIEMLMREVGYYPFKNEDEMIYHTSVDDNLYKQAIKEVEGRNIGGDR
jgi:predicted GNAT family acetyltransferase